MNPLKPLTRFETVVALLDTYHDAQETLQAGANMGDGDGGYLTMPNLWHQGSYAELERVLRTMRSLAKQKVVRYTDNGAEKTMPLGTAYWHAREWWIDSTCRIALACPNCPPADRKRFERLPHKHKGKPNKPILVRDLARHPDAREVKAMAGAQWIADQMRGSPQLPLPFLENLTGYVPPGERKAA